MSESQDPEFSFRTKNQSGIEGELKLTREEIRAIKKLAEQRMREQEADDGYEEASWVFKLGGSNWADLDDLRTKCKMWLVDNQ